MPRILAVLPIVLGALSGCSLSQEYPYSDPGPASAYTPGSVGAPSDSNAPQTSGIGGTDRGAGPGSDGVPTNPAQGGAF